MAKGGKGGGAKGGRGDQPRDREGQFASKGGAGGSMLMATARRVGEGGSTAKRLSKARQRLADASAHVRKVRSHGDKDLWARSLAMAERSEAFHQKQVDRLAQQLKDSDRGPHERSPEFRSERAAKSEGRAAMLRAQLKTTRAELRSAEQRFQSEYDAAKAAGKSGPAVASWRDAQSAQVRLSDAVDKLKHRVKVHERDRNRLMRSARSA